MFVRVFVGAAVLMVCWTIFMLTNREDHPRLNLWSEYVGWFFIGYTSAIIFSMIWSHTYG